EPLRGLLAIDLSPARAPPFRDGSNSRQNAVKAVRLSQSRRDGRIPIVTCIPQILKLIDKHLITRAFPLCWHFGAVAGQDARGMPNRDHQSLSLPVADRSCLPRPRRSRW